VHAAINTEARNCEESYQIKNIFSSSGMKGAGMSAYSPENTSDDRQDADDVLDKGCMKLKSRHLTKLKVTVFRMSSMKKEETVIQVHKEEIQLWVD
jgi:hypothetical protein